MKRRASLETAGCRRCGWADGPPSARSRSVAAPASPRRWRARPQRDAHRHGGDGRQALILGRTRSANRCRRSTRSTARPARTAPCRACCDLMGLHLHPYAASPSPVIAIDKQLTKQASGAARHPDAGRPDGGLRGTVRPTPLPRPLCGEAGQRRHRRSALRSSRRKAITAIRSAADVAGPWQEFDELLAEPFIRGRELTVAVLGDRVAGRHRAETKERLLRL